MSRRLDQMDSAGAARRLVMLSYHFPPDAKIGAARPYRFARYLERSGCPVSVVSAAPGGTEESTKALAHAAGTWPSATARRTSSVLGSIERRILPYNDRLPWVPQAYVEASAEIAADPDGVVLFSTSPPVATHLAALLLKRTHHVPWIADFRDPFWGNPTRTSRRAAALDPLLERSVFQHADAIIANTDVVAQLWAKRHPRWAAKIHVIWNGFDPEDLIDPSHPPSSSRPILAHVGEIYGARSPTPIASSLQRLLSAGALQSDDLELRLVGPMDDRARDEMNQPVLRWLAERGQLHVDARLLPQDEARREMLAARWLLLLDMPARHPGLQLPAKVFDYVRTGRPILAVTSPGSATERMLARSVTHYACIDPAAPPAVMDAKFAAFLRKPAASCTPTPVFWEEFDAQHQTAELARIIAAVGTPPRAALGTPPRSTAGRFADFGHADAGADESHAA